MKSFHVSFSKVLGMDSGGPLFLQPPWGKKNDFIIMLWEEDVFTTISNLIALKPIAALSIVSYLLNI